MAQDTYASDDGPAAGYVQFWSTGESVKGEFHCAECGYGIAVCRELPRCPMEELPAAEVDEVARLPKAVQLAAERARAGAVLQVPIVLDDAVLASLELMRPRMRFSADERVAVYLRDDGRLGAAAGRGLAGPHVRVAERLLELAVGPYRGRGILVVEDAAADPQLSPAADAVAEAGIDAAVAPPARRARPRGARARRRLRVVGAGRRRRRRLRLPPAPGRPARGRARRRPWAPDRGHGPHGEGEVA